MRSGFTRATDGPATPRRRARLAARLVALVVGLALLGAACSDEKPSSAAVSNEMGATGQVASPGVSTAPDEPVEKITVAGDSISVGLGSALREAVGDDVTVKVIGEVGSGLASPNAFDWPERLRELARDYPPDVLVFSLSSNDARDLVDEDGKLVASRADEAKWDLEYAARLAESFDAFEDTGTTVLWVGHVRTSKDKVGLANRHIQQLAAQVASTRPWVVVQDLASILGSGETVAKSCLVPDGLHLKADCLEMAALRLIELPPIA